jgi:hypothetical protein
MPCPGAKSGWNHFASRRGRRFGGRFEQMRFRDQRAHLPALLLLERGRSYPQSFDVLHHLLSVDEVQLMKIVEVMQEELHGPPSWSEPSRSSSATV